MGGGYTPERAAEVSRLYAAIAGVTTRFTFTRPVEPGDLEIVRQALAQALPAGFGVKLEDDPPTYVLILITRPNGDPVYRREMIVEDSPT